jgi:hypothetical protein
LFEAEHVLLVAALKAMPSEVRPLATGETAHSAK